jgi:hypothetical protein
VVMDCHPVGILLSPSPPSADVEASTRVARPST